MNRLVLGYSLLFLSLRIAANVHAQVPADIRDLKLRDWKPRSMLVSRTTNVPKAKFPVVDVHNHLGGGKAILTAERVARYLVEFDPARGHHLQGFWMIYGIFPPDDVLAKLYNGNARKIIYGLADRPPDP